MRVTGATVGQGATITLDDHQVAIDGPGVEGTAEAAAVLGLIPALLGGEALEVGGDLTAETGHLLFVEDLSRRPRQHLVDDETDRVRADVDDRDAAAMAEAAGRAGR